MKVAIIGAGLAGLTLAQILEKHGILYDLFEEKGDLRACNAGLILAPNASMILNQINLLGLIKNEAQQISSLEYSDEKLSPLFKVEAEKLGLENHSQLFGIREGDLKQILFQNLSPSKIHFKSKLSDISKRMDKTLIKFDQGDSRDYDLVIAADGLHSTVRSMLFPYIRPEYSGQSSWHFISPRELYPMSSEIAFELYGKKRSFNIFGLNNKEWAWSLTTATLPEQKGIDQKQIFLDLFQQFDHTVLKLIKESSLDKGYKRDLFELPPLTYMESGRVLFIGDAAHTLPNILHQGTAQAFEDAWYLGKTIVESKNLDLDLKQLIKERKKRLQYLEQTLSIVEEVGQFHGHALKKMGRNLMKLVPGMLYEQMLKKIFKIKL